MKAGCVWMNHNLNENGKLLRTYKVTYISGAPNFKKIKRGLLMQLYSNAFVFSGKSFPTVCIPYASVINFNLAVGYGSLMDFRPSDMASAKVIELTYVDEYQQINLIKFELAPSVNVFNDYRTRMELVPFLKASGIFDKFNLSAHAGQSNDITAQIEKLAELNKAGILTDDEFQIKKEELLKRI